MQIKIESKHLGGDVVVVLPEIFQDPRGFFTETFRADQFADLGLPTQFVQDNHSRSSKGVLRGLHFQWEPPMGKIMRVTRGAPFSSPSTSAKAHLRLGNGSASKLRMKTGAASGLRRDLLVDSAPSPT